MKNDIPIASLRAMLSYDPETGIISWNGANLHQPKGRRALATLSPLGHLVGSINNRQFKASRVAWALHYGHWPESTLKHLNGDNCDLSISNLAYGRRTTSTEQRFHSYLGPKTLSGCIEWQGGLGTGGYGKFRAGKGSSGSTSAHRFAYEIAKGPIPPDMFVCHSCDNPRCCNPDHLWLGTPNDNVQDMVAKKRHLKPKTHCKYGHTLSEENRRRLHGRLTYRCRACGTAAMKRSVAKKRGDIGCAHQPLFE